MLPNLHHSELKVLYENDFSIAKSKLEAILALPRESLLEDFKLILNDARENFDVYEQRINEGEENASMAPVHVFFLAGELEAVEILDDLISFLNEPHYQVDFWLGDTITEFLPILLYKIAHKDIERLFPSMDTPELEVFIKIAFSVAAGLTAYHFPDQRAKVTSFYQNKIGNLIKSVEEEGGWNGDYELLTLMIQEGLIIGFVEELKPLTEEAIEKGLIAEFFITEEELVELLSGEGKYGPEYEITSIFEEYRKAEKLFNYEPPEYKDQDFFLPDEEPLFFEEDHRPFEHVKTVKRESPKVGRNDPCPCGSGKKYKKCCGKR